MKIGPKYKIARKLNAPIFEKTQSAKFEMAKEKKGRSKPKSSYGLQMNEKQKAKFTYGLTEKQFKNSVKSIIEVGTGSQTEKLYEALELRLDNVIARAGFSSTRRHGRQLVSHGHITVNGKKVSIPSYHVKKGDVVGIRSQSLVKPVFSALEERLKTMETVSWMSGDLKNKTVKIERAPKYEPGRELFDLQAVFEFYRR